jgi:hypothetical protein
MRIIIIVSIFFLTTISSVLLTSCFDRCEMEQQACLERCKYLENTDRYEDCIEDCGDDIVECWDSYRIKGKYTK